MEKIQSTCQIEDHCSKTLAFICTNPNCTNNRFLCLDCLKTIHLGCVNFVLDINSISSRNFLENKDWVMDPDIKQAIIALEKNKITGSIDELLNIYEDKISKEFNRLSEWLNQKLQDAKQKMIQNLKTSHLIAGSQNSPEEFTKQLKSLYNFDLFAGILESWKREGKNIKVASDELDAFFKDTASKKQMLDNLKQAAQKLNVFIKEFVQIDVQPFERFKCSIEEILKASIFLQNGDRWHWNPSQKSSQISLSDNNTTIRRLNGNGYSAVLGNIKMSKGCYKWSLEVATNNNAEEWLGFGIIKDTIAPNLENFPYSSSIFQSTNDSKSQLDVVENLANYDNKTYICELNFNQGKFTISCQEKVIRTAAIGNQTYIPFVIIYNTENTAKLHVIQ